MKQNISGIVDQLLVMAAMDGDAKAMEMLVGRWQKRLWGYVHRRILDSQATWDITQQCWLDIVKGAFQSFSRRPKFLKVNTPYLNGSVEGTEFLVRVDADATTFTVFEGMVVAANERGKLAIVAGETAQAA